MWAAAGKFLVLAGAVLVLLGLILWVGRFPGLGFLGRLPGDLHVRSKNVVIYIPLATSILVSLVLTVLLNLFFRR